MKLRDFKVALLLIPVAAAVLAQGPKVDLIHLDPQPAISSGCPAHVHFTGRIRANGPLDVEYQWMRSDGSHTEHTLRFPRATELPVSTNWSLSTRYSGWMQLVILSPKRMQTAKASFSVNCGK
jgi:hypothetical protein